MIGSASNDMLSGTDAANVLRGGAGDDILHGQDGNDTLYGDAGNDQLFGDAGADTMYGGAGDDTYQVENAGDVVVETAGEGTDEVDVLLGSAYTVGDNIEIIKGFATGGVILTGGNTGASLYGTDAADTLTGGAGNDKLYGGMGNDTLYGGAGNDEFYGGAGNDTYYGGAGDDYYEIRDAADVAIETANGGTDRVDVFINSAYTVGDNIEYSSTESRPAASTSRPAIPARRCTATAMPTR